MRPDKRHWNILYYHEHDNLKNNNYISDVQGLGLGTL